MTKTNIVDAIVVGILLGIFVSLMVADIYCTYIWDNPTGFIGCSVSKL